MPVVTVNGHVLLPHYPDWAGGVRRERLWQTAVDRALNRTFYLFIGTGNSSNYGVWNPFAFGEFDSFVPGDAYNVLICAAQSLTVNSSYLNNATLGGNGYVMTYHLSAASADYYLPANIGQVVGNTVGTSLPGSGLLRQSGSGTGYFCSAGHLGYPHQAEGGLYVAPKLLGHYLSGTGWEMLCCLRGRLRGLWTPLHPYSFAAAFSTWSGAGAEAGKTFELGPPIHCQGSSQAVSTYTIGVLAIETSATLS